jgi:type III secretion protein V
MKYSISNAQVVLNEESLVGRLARRSDILLVLFVVAIIALMIAPIPVALLDALIAINIAISICLLMLSIYVQSPGALSTFPSLLLFTTLLRLALNIASTKQILLHAHAGAVIETFGRLVVGGNVVVGGVVFLIICIVQFIVIAKGAERVAEVGARFTLDALPGKQMSIDADLRAGMIDKEEGRRRRSELEKESQWHGAMDGAMKFVKGDAIAGLVIAFVNILAGIAIGAGMNGMSIAEAGARYTLLTVGEGMISQIPSLFVSVSAGILITRVSGPPEGGSNLGNDLGQQILSNPAALAMTAAVVAAFLIIPGIPRIQFFLIAATLGGVALMVFRLRRKQQDADFQRVKAMRADGDMDAPMFVDQDVHKSALPVVLCLSPALKHKLSASRFGAALEISKNHFYRDLGLPFPGVRIRYEESLPDDGYGIVIHDLLVYAGKIVIHAPGNPGAQKGEPREPEDLATDAMAVSSSSGALTPADSTFSGNDLTVLRPQGTLMAEEYLAQAVTVVVRQHADLFMGIQEVQWITQSAAVSMPQLIEELLKVVPLPRIAEVLRRLIQEGIPIRNQRQIFESLISWASKEKDVVMLTEYVRVDIGRIIAHRFAKGSKELSVIVLASHTEELIRESIQSTLGGSFLALDPERSDALVKAISHEIESRQFDKPSVIVCSMDIRRYLKNVLPPSLKSIEVLSYQELGSHIELKVVCEIAIN